MPKLHIAGIVDGVDDLNVKGPPPFENRQGIDIGRHLVSAVTATTGGLLLGFGCPAPAQGAAFFAGALWVLPHRRDRDDQLQQPGGQSFGHILTEFVHVYFLEPLQVVPQLLELLIVNTPPPHDLLLFSLVKLGNSLFQFIKAKHCGVCHEKAQDHSAH